MPQNLLRHRVEKWFGATEAVVYSRLDLYVLSVSVWLWLDWHNYVLVFPRSKMPRNLWSFTVVFAENGLWTQQRRSKIFHSYCSLRGAHWVQEIGLAELPKFQHRGRLSLAWSSLGVPALFLSFLFTLLASSSVPLSVLFFPFESFSFADLVFLQNFVKSLNLRFYHYFFRSVSENFRFF